ncbi:MAG: GNAT family N-acetyltransferase [Pirellulaceae bacterium]
MNEVRLEPMSVVQYAEFMEAILPAYVAARSAADHVSMDEAERFASDQHRLLLPAGKATPGHQFQAIMAPASEQPVGGVWFYSDCEKGQAYLYNITVYPPWCRRGFATAALALVEEAVRSAGCKVLALNVFAENVGAAELYLRSGYARISSHMNKRL